MSERRVLLVDDEPDLRLLVGFNLRSAGFEVEEAGTGDAALAAIGAQPFDVVVLDLMLPDIPGLEVCRRIRAMPACERVGILMLTARGDEYDRLLGFELGADDYVVKPFSVREIVHRVRALARRTAGSASAEVMTWRGLSLDDSRHRVLLDGAELSLRPLEFRLLRLLMAHKGEVLSRSQLLADAWGISADIDTRTVDTHVRRLREALGACGDAIETVRGFGYRFRSE